MIAVLPPDCPPGLLDEIREELGRRGWEHVLSTGREQTVLAVAGPREAEELDDLLRPRVDADVFALRSRREYEQAARRRTFLHRLVGGLGVLTALGLVFPALGFLRAPHEVLSRRDLVPVARIESIPEDGARLVRLADERLYVVRLAGERYFALSARCTNAEGCQLDWSRERLQLVCPCDGGVFDVHGNVVEGSPWAPLPSYPVEPIRGELYVDRR